MKKLYDAIGIASFPPVLDFFVTLVFLFFGAALVGPAPLWHVFLAAFLFITAVPFVPAAYSVMRGHVDFYFIDRKDRTLFFLIAGGSYLIAAAFFLALQSQLMFYLALSYAVIDFAIMAANLFWKISVHATIAGPVTAIAYVFGWQFLVLHVLTLLVMLSRLKLKVHTPMQILAGAVVSAVITFFVFYMSMPL